MLANKTLVLAGACALAMLTGIASAQAPPKPPLNDAPIFAQVLQPPTPMVAANHAYLVYEIYLTNFQRAPVTIEKLKVGGLGVNSGKSFSFEKGELARMTQPVGTAPKPEDVATIAPGATSILFVWLEFPAVDAIPPALKNEITFGGLDRRVLSAALELEPIRPGMRKTVIGPPLGGDHWVAFNGPSNTSVHRRACLLKDGRPYFAQRYALDLVQVGADGKTFQGDSSKNENYHCYGAEVLAVADGTVVEVTDGIPQNVPNERGEHAVPITFETIAGNHVVIDIGGGSFAGYAHLVPGSVKVKRGDRVTRGQILGKLGNSGNSSEPHLHFQVANGRSFIGSDGVPYVFDAIAVYPKAAQAQGDKLVVDFNARPVPIANQLVLENAIINFPAH